MSWKDDPLVNDWQNDALITPDVQYQNDPIHSSREERLNWWEDFRKGLVVNPEKFVPWLGQGIQAVQLSEAAEAAHRLEIMDYSEEPKWAKVPSRVPQELAEQMVAGSAYPYGSPYTIKGLTSRPDWTPQRQFEHDLKLVEQAFPPDFTTWGKAGDILGKMPAFMVEWIAAGALVGGAKQAAGQTLKQALSKGTFYLKTAGLRTALAPGMILQSYERGGLPTGVHVDETGKISFEWNEEKSYVRAAKAVGDVYIEMLSEQVGDDLLKGVGGALGYASHKLPFGRKFTDALFNGWKRLHPKGKWGEFRKLLKTKTGFHGMLGEVGEEYVGDALRALTGVDDFGSGSKNPLTRLSHAVQSDIENTLPMVLAFSFPAVVQQATGLVGGKIKSKNAAIRKQVADYYQAITQQELTVPSEIATAEGIIGAELDEEVPKEVFPKHHRFKEAGLAISLGLTPKLVANNLLGLDPVFEDLEAAWWQYQADKLDLHSWSNKVTSQAKKLPLKSIGKTIETEIGKVLEGEGELPLFDLAKLTQFREKLGKKPKPIGVMRDLLDTYEEAPEWLDSDSQRVFNQIRALTNHLLERANKVRAELGMSPINKLEGYIPHWLDSVAQKLLEDVVDFEAKKEAGYVAPLPDWAYKMFPKVAKKMDNPLQKHRQARDFVEKYFSKDLNTLLKTMINYDLRDIYLLQPYQAAVEELNELKKKNLIPNSTFQEASKFLMYDIRRFQTPLDAAFNVTVKKPTDFINKILLPFGKTISDPSRALFRTTRRMGMLSGLGLRLKSPIRNLGQRTLMLDMYRAVDIGRAQAVATRLAKMPQVEHPFSGEMVPLLDLIREQDWYKVSLGKFEDTMASMTRIENWSLKLYSRSHIGNQFLSNVELAAMTGYFDWLHNYNLSQDKTSLHYKRCLAESIKTKTSVEELLTNKNDMMWAIRESVRRTQWEYASIAMPGMYRGEVIRGSAQFQSWWMNYLFNHVRECINQTVTGKNSRGKLLTPGARLRAVKGMGTIAALGKAFEQATNIKTVAFLFAVAPAYLPPIPRLIADILQYFSGDDEQKKRSAKRIKEDLKFLVPFSVAWKELNKLLSGEYDIWEYLTYQKEKK